MRSAPSNNPKPQETGKGVQCLQECKPSYPSVLNGAEGSATLQLLISPNGDVVKAMIVKPNNNSQINEQAVIAAQKMRFSASPHGGRASVPLTINFTVAGSEFDRRAREEREQEQRERQAREQERQARQAQLEQEQRERQRQLELERVERERQARQAQLEQEQQERQQQLELERANQENQQSLPEIEELVPSTTEEAKEEQSINEN